MAWKKKLWGVEFTGSMPGDKPGLLGTSWMNPRPQSQYEGEPARAILFMTRKQAREWCRKKRATYAGRGDCCEQWKFTPVRVMETVAVMSNALGNRRAAFGASVLTDGLAGKT